MIAGIGVLRDIMNGQAVSICAERSPAFDVPTFGRANGKIALRASGVV
jgi:hypothetical protein